MAIVIPQTLDDSAEKSALDTMLQGWLDDAKTVHMDLVTRYDQIDAMMNSKVVMAGFASDARAELEKLNDAKTPADYISRWAVTLNRMRPNHESVLGEFVQARRKLSLTGRTGKDRSFAKVFKKRIEHIEDANLVPELVLLPAYDEAFSKGVSWIKLGYDGLLNQPVKKYLISHVSARDVLVDPAAKSIGFATRKYAIHRMKFNLDDAVEAFADLPFFDGDRLVADTEYYDGYPSVANLGMTRNDECTIYEFHFSQTEADYFMGNPQTKLINPITRDLYVQMRGNPQTAELVFVAGRQQKHYVALYNTVHGCFHIEEDKRGMSGLIPLVNIHSQAQFWPIGDVELYANLNQLLDATLTVMLENARKHTRPIVSVREDVFLAHGAAVEKAIDNGGAVPDAGGVYYPNAGNQALGQLVPWLIQWMQDTASRHSASMGELPSPQIAKETVLALIQKDRTGHGRKDAMVSLLLRQMGRGLVKMISVFDRDEDFVPVTDARPGEADYVPINVQWSYIEYLMNLADMIGVPLPQGGESQEEAAAALQQIDTYRKKFEAENSVEMEEFDGFEVGTEQYKPEELAQVISAMNLTPDEFEGIYSPKPGKYTRVYVNRFSEDIDLNVVYGVDTDQRNDPQFQVQKAIAARREGGMSLERYMEALGFQDPQEMVDEARRENAAMALAQEVAANPQLAQAVMALVQQFAQGGGQPGGTGGRPDQDRNGERAGS